MEKSNIDASIKEAVIAEVKKLTGYTPSSPNKLNQFLDGNFSIKYVHDNYLRIANGDIGIMFTPKADPSDLIWQKAAEMLKIAVKVPEPPKKEAPEYIPPTPPVNPIEQALAEIDQLKIRVAELEKPLQTTEHLKTYCTEDTLQTIKIKLAELESVKDVEIKALRDRLSKAELDSKTLANLAYNRGFSMGNGTMQPIHKTKNADFEYWWTEFRKENGFK